MATDNKIQPPLQEKNASKFFKFLRWLKDRGKGNMTYFSSVLSAPAREDGTDSSSSLWRPSD